MTLIHHPGSACQIAALSPGAAPGGITLMLTDAHAVISDLAGGAAPAAAAQAAARLRDADSPCTLITLAAALDEVVTWLHQARRDVTAGIPGS
jgi:hypothetical protein